MGHTATKLKDFVFPQGPRRWKHHVDIGTSHNHAMLSGLPFESFCSFLLRLGRSTGILCSVAEALVVAEHLAGWLFSVRMSCFFSGRHDESRLHLLWNPRLTFCMGNVHGCRPQCSRQDHSALQAEAAKRVPAESVDRLVLLLRLLRARLRKKSP